MWCSVDGGENVFIKDKESESDKAIDIKITDGKYEFVELMKTINELNDENEQLRQSKEILQQEIGDTQKILEMLSEKLKGWNDE